MREMQSMTNTSIKNNLSIAPFAFNIIIRRYSIRENVIFRFDVEQGRVQPVLVGRDHVDFLKLI